MSIVKQDGQKLSVAHELELLAYFPFTRLKSACNGMYVLPRQVSDSGGKRLQ